MLKNPKNPKKIRTPYLGVNNPSVAAVRHKMMEPGGMNEH